MISNESSGRIPRRWRPLSLILPAALACSSPAGRTAADGAALTGRWGGDHIALTLTPDAGTLEYDCAHGGISEALRPDADGRFEAAGVHVREHGGPMRVGERPDSVPARYLGRVRDSRLTLRVVVGSDTLGPYELRRDAEPRLVKCL